MVKERLVGLFLKLTWLDWLLVLVFLASFVYLIFFGWSRLQRRIVPVEYLAASEAASGNSLFVDVGGAVVSPGVYELQADARVKDALVAAGGMTDQADREYLARNLNLAEKVKDGQKIYIPVKGRESSSIQGASATLVNINSATEAELDSLPSIGPARAGEIVSGRPYSSVDELLSRGILPKNVFEEIKNKISVY